jgi:hypothetical protein
MNENQSTKFDGSLNAHAVILRLTQRLISLYNIFMNLSSIKIY